MERLISKAATLVEALPYIQKFRDAVIVVKFGGSAMEDPELTRSVVRDIVILECIGLRPVVVHGGGKAITAKLKEFGIPTHFVNGLRYTCDKTVKVVDDVLHNDVNKNIIGLIQEWGGKGQKISGKEIIRARRNRPVCPETGKELDVGFVGDITSVDTQLIMATVEAELIPVITPLGTDDEGQVYNINADTAACEIAEALKARKLVFLSDVPGILRDPKDEESLISTIRAGDVDDLIKDKVISGGMLPKIKSCLHALDAGINKVHMIDGRVTHSLLLEIFTDSGVGTEIIKD